MAYYEHILLALLEVWWRFCVCCVGKARAMAYTPDLRGTMSVALNKRKSIAACRVYPGFCEHSKRLLVKVREEAWAKLPPESLPILVPAILQDGSVESTAKLRRGKGLFGFCSTQTYTGTCPPPGPYGLASSSLLGGPGVVRLWTVTLEGLDSVFHFTDPKTQTELQDTIADMRQVLKAALPEELAEETDIQLAERKMQTCSTSPVLAAPDGQSLVDAMQHPLVRHALRCTVTENGAGDWTIHACRGSGKTPYSVSVRAKDSGTVAFERGGPAPHYVTQPTREFHADGKAFAMERDMTWAATTDVCRSVSAQYLS